MKAIVQEGYGTPAVLGLREVELPDIGEDGILLEVHAASVNALDWHMTRGMPYIIRLVEGFRTPKDRIRGVDVAGRVAAAGSHVKRFKTGDEVFGGADGSFAELTATTEDRLARKPSNWSYEEAASLYIAGMTALQGLRDRAQVQPGQRVVINGAGGGVGVYAVQIAKWLGAHVTAVSRTENLDLLASLGADEVVDHRKEDFTQRNVTYDVLFDIGGSHGFKEYRRVLTPAGVIVVVGGAAGRLAPASRFLHGAALSPFVSQRILPFVSKIDRDCVDLLAELAGRGAIRPVIGRSFTLGEAAEAVRFVGEGNARGKVTIRVR